MDGRAKIVPEAGKRQFEGARSAAGNGLGLEELDLEPGLGEDNGGREAVGAGTDDAGFGNVSWHFARGRCWPRSRRESQHPMLRAKCQSRIYSLGCTSGDWMTWMLPSDSRSRVGAYSPRYSRRHQFPVARFSAMVVNQYCQSTARICRGGESGNGFPRNSVSTSLSFASRRTAVFGTITASRQFVREANHRFQSKRG